MVKRTMERKMVADQDLQLKTQVYELWAHAIIGISTIGIIIVVSLDVNID